MIKICNKLIVKTMLAKVHEDQAYWPRYILEYLYLSAPSLSLVLLQSPEYIIQHFVYFDKL